MVEGLPLELLQAALAGIGERGELRAATPVMARWLGARGVADLATLPLDAEQRAALQAGGAVLLQDGAESFELQRLEHDGRSWLRVRDDT